MNIPSEDIKDILVSVSALALTFAFDLFIGAEPTEPDDCVTIFDTMGAGDTLTLDQQSYEQPAIQIRVRNNGYKGGLELIRTIQNTLHGRANETWNGTMYMLIENVNGPTFLRRDDSDRFIFISNFQIQRRSI